MCLRKFLIELAKTNCSWFFLKYLVLKPQHCFHGLRTVSGEVINLKIEIPHQIVKNTFCCIRLHGAAGFYLDSWLYHLSLNFCSYHMFWGHKYGNNLLSSKRLYSICKACSAEAWNSHKGVKVVLFPESPTTHPKDTFKAILLEMNWNKRKGRS